EPVTGGREIERAVDLATLPLYVRAGAILPFGPVKQYADEAVEGSPQLRIYPGADGEFFWYEDDGASLAYERGEFTRIGIAWDDSRRELRLALAPGSQMLVPRPRTFEIELRGQSSKKQIEFDGEPLTLRL